MMTGCSLATWLSILLKLAIHIGLDLLGLTRRGRRFPIVPRCKDMDLVGYEGGTKLLYPPPSVSNGVQKPTLQIVTSLPCTDLLQGLDANM